MAGSRALRKIQLGQESTAGTPVAATALWRGLGTIQDFREINFPEEDVGILGGTSRSNVTRVWSQLSMPATAATFEQLPYILAAGVEDVTTGAADGAGSSKIYQYDASTTAQNSVQTFTIEGGDDQQAEETDYCFVQSFTLEGSGQDPVNVSAEWIGRQVTNTTFTGAISIPSVEDIVTNTGTLYIDATGGTIGSTAVSNTLFGFTLNWNTGLNPYWALDGSKEFSIHKFTTDEITLQCRFEHNASAVTEKAQYRTDPPPVRLVQLKFEGSDVATPGTTYSKLTMIINLAGIWSEWSALDEQDGNDVIDATLTCRYSDNDTFKAQIIVVNELTSLT